MGQGSRAFLVTGWENGQGRNIEAREGVSHFLSLLSCRRFCPTLRTLATAG